MKNYIIKMNLIFYSLMLILLISCTKDPSQYRISKERKMELQDRIEYLDRVIKISYDSGSRRVWYPQLKGELIESFENMEDSLNAYIISSTILEIIAMEAQIRTEFEEDGYDIEQWKETEIGMWFNDFYEVLNKHDEEEEFYPGQFGRLIQYIRIMPYK